MLQLRATEARRVLMMLQGLGRPERTRCGPAMLGRVIDDLGFVQVDSIRVLERAQHLILRSRLSGYHPRHLRKLLSDRVLFEHWTHDASVIPTRWLPHWMRRFKRDKVRIPKNAWWAERMGPDPVAVLKAVKRRIRRDGPLRSIDFKHEENADRGGWWKWKPAKAALEYLWRCGELAVSHRDEGSFQKWYDLRERVLPRVGVSSSRAHVDWACSEALARLGTATSAELAAFFRAIPLADARTWAAQAVASGDAIEVEVERLDRDGPMRCLARPDIQTLVRRAATCDRFNDTAPRLLCPFDPVVRDRARLLRLFNFEYRLGAFTPAAKRTQGYYALPILQGDAFVGRIDLKADRAQDELQIKGLWWEDSARPDRRSLEGVLASLAEFTGVSRVV
ncbi:MAG: winged helix DNA-binding domain-containing protein [Phycisphaerales bacterium]|nr:winged helix DNA-binding domain-containing protein [Phycisphaerales bacterium]